MAVWLAIVLSGIRLDSAGLFRGGVNTAEGVHWVGAEHLCGHLAAQLATFEVREGVMNAAIDSADTHFFFAGEKG